MTPDTMSGIIRSADTLSDITQSGKAPLERMVIKLAQLRKSADERKEQILNASLKLFSCSSYNLIVMDDIAKACNIARTTLYEYYSNKEEILIALVERVALEAREIEICGNTCMEQLEFLAENLIDKIQKNKAVYRTLFQATPVMSRGLSSKIIDWREQNFHQVYKAVETGKTSRKIRDNMSIDDVVFAYQAYVGQRTGELIMTNEEVDPKSEARRLIEMLWYGIGEND